MQPVSCEALASGLPSGRPLWLPLWPPGVRRGQRPRLAAGAAGRGSEMVEETEGTGRSDSGTRVCSEALGLTAAFTQGIWRGEKPSTRRQPPAGEASLRSPPAVGSRQQALPLSAFLSEPCLFSSGPSPATLPAPLPAKVPHDFPISQKAPAPCPPPSGGVCQVLRLPG